MDDNFYEPAFVIYGKPPKPKPPAPPPTPQPPPPSDRVLSFHKRQEWQFAVARPVFTDGQRTGEWLVGSKRHKHDEPQRWMLMPNEDRAIEWCMKVNDHRSKKRLTYNFFFEMMRLTVTDTATSSNTWPLKLASGKPFFR